MPLLSLINGHLSSVIGYWFVEQAFQPVELIVELSH
jgi:hypothetical protein